MRTLTEKYNAILEGNYSKSQFVRDARLSHPNFINQFTSYEDAVTILKAKGLVYENISMHDSTDKDRNVRVKKEIRNKKVQIKHESTNTYTSLQVIKMAKRAGEYVLDARDSLRELVIGYGDNIPKDEVLQVLSHYDLDLKQVTGKPSSETHPTDGSPTDTEIPSWLLESEHEDFTELSFSPSRIDRAIKLELEKMGLDQMEISNPTEEEYVRAKSTVLRNLKKNSNYYDAAIIANFLPKESGKKPVQKVSDKMQPVTSKNKVDKANGLQTVKVVKESKGKTKKFVKIKEDHSKDSSDKYTVKKCPKEGNWKVWEGDHLVKRFDDKAKAQAFANKKNKEQGLSENKSRTALKEAIKELIKSILA